MSESMHLPSELTTPRSPDAGQIAKIDGREMLYTGKRWIEAPRASEAVRALMHLAVGPEPPEASG